MASLTLTNPIQQGVWTRSTSTWVDAGSANITNNEELWTQWDVNAVGTTSRVDSGFLTNRGTSSGDFIFDVLVYDGPLTTDFSTAANPPVGTFRKEVLGSFTVTHPGPGGVEIYFPFTLPLHTSVGSATAVMNSLRAPRPLDALGRRRFGIGFRLSPSSPTNFWGSGTFNQSPTPSQLTVSNQFTGLVGHYEARGRADECPVCGRKSTRDTWVRSGYLQMMVCPECYDEPDLVGRSYQGLGSERPGSGEG